MTADASASASLADDGAGWMDAARAIGDRLCAQAWWRDGTCTWSSGGTSISPEGGMDGRMAEGTAGIALFLHRLHRAAGGDAYRETAAGALAHAIAREPARPAAHGFHHGTAGVAAVCAELGADTGEARWTDAALALCRGVEAMPRGGLAEVAAGEAGTVLGLLRVHALTGDDGPIRIARALGEGLLHRRRREAEGISWDGAGTAGVRIGLPHGAGGIGLALLELHRATGEERFVLAAAQALAYEDGWRDAAGEAWRDPRLLPATPAESPARLHQLRRAAARDTLAPAARLAPADWEDGAAGIALVRARFLAVTGAERYRALLARAAARCRDASADPRDPVLATGAAGRADALLEAARHAGPAEAEAARRFAAIAREGADGLPPGLLGGAAGIGLLCLRMADPSLLSPLLPVPDRVTAPPADGEALVARGIRSLCHEHFARTVDALARIRIHPPEVEGEGCAAFRAALEGRIGALPAEGRARAAAAFAVESAVWEMARTHADGSARLAGALLRPPPRRLDEDDTLVQRSPRVRLVHPTHAFDGDEPSPGTWLVYEGDRGWTAQRLDALGARLLSAVERPVAVGALLGGMMDALGAAGREDADAVRERLRTSLRQAFARGLVDIPDPHGLRPADVTGELCMHCGACCRVKLYIPGNEAHREYVAAVLEAPLRAAYPELAIHHERTAAGEHVVLDLGDCRHLEHGRDADGRATVRCGIYEERPPVCRSFNCVAWGRLQRAEAAGPVPSDAILRRVAALRATLKDPTS